MIRHIGFAGLLACMLAVNSNAQLTTKKALTLAAAKKIAAAAEAEALKNKWTVVISIVDDGGNLLYLERMDGTQLGSIEVAQAKARSALLYKRPTKVFQDRVAGGEGYLMTLPGAAPVEGGLPIVLDGEFLGAVGCSGMTSAQDAQVASAGIAALTR